MAHFDDLPTEIVSLIISHLHQLIRSAGWGISEFVKYNVVSKRFQDAINSIVWRSVVLDPWAYRHRYHGIMYDLARPSIGQHVRHFTFIDPPMMYMLVYMLRYFNQVTCLELPKANNIDDSVIQRIHKLICNLTCLKIENAAITERSIKLIVEHCQQLTILKLYRCPRLTCVVLPALAGASSSLQQLDINVHPAIRPNWMTIDTASIIINSSSSSSSSNGNTLFGLGCLNVCKSLTRRIRRIINNTNNNNDINKASNNVHYGSSRKIDETELVMDAIRLTRLTEFKLIGAPTRFVQQLLSTLTTPNDDDGRAWPCLVGLSLSDTDGTIGDDRLVPFIQARPKLTALSLAGTNMTDATLTAIAQFLPDIHTIEITDGQRISSRGVRRLARQCSRVAEIRIKERGPSSSDFPEGYSDSSEDDVILNQRAIDDIQQCYSSDPEEVNPYLR